MTRRRRRIASPALFFSLLAGSLTAGAGVALAYQGMNGLLAYLLGVNASTVGLYGYDKLAAKGRWLRVPERILHLLALLGGTPGALAAQRFFRHKTIKRSFRVAFWLLAILQLAVVGWIVGYFYFRH